MRWLLGRWWLRWIVLPLVALFVAHGIWTLVLKWRFEWRLNVLRAAGAPVDLRDLRRPPVADEDNAAALWEEAHRWYAEHLIAPPQYLQLPEDTWSEEHRADIVAWLAQGDPYVDLLARVAEKPALFENLNWEAGPDLVVTAIPRMQDAANFLGDRVRLAERATPEVLRELAVLLDLAPKLERPLIILMLVRRTVEGVAAESLRALAAKPGFDAQAARALLDRRFRATDDQSHMREALEGERAVGLSLSRRWIGGEGPFGMIQEAQDVLGEAEEKRDLTLLNAAYGSWLARPLAYQDALRLLDLMERAIGLVDLPAREALPKAVELREEYFRGPPNVFSHLFASWPVKVFRHRLRHDAKMRMARVGLALLELRQTTGAWPESLEAVVPLVGEEWVEDPFTGERLQYEPGVRLEAAAPIAHEELRADDEIVWRFGG